MSFGRITPVELENALVRIAWIEDRKPVVHLADEHGTKGVGCIDEFVAILDTLVILVVPKRDVSQECIECPLGGTTFGFPFAFVIRLGCTRSNRP